MPNDDHREYLVVVNHEEQYSIWPASRKLPAAGVPRDPLTRRRIAWPTSTRSGPTCGH